MLVDITNEITNWIFPRRCGVCGNDIAKDSLCETCLSLVTRATRKNLMLRDAKPALFFYEGIIRQLTIQAKFHRSLLHAHILMQLAKKELVSSMIGDEVKAYAPDCITYVPTHWLRRLTRRIELPCLFAMTLSKIFNVPLTACLIRRNFQRQALRATKHERRKGIIDAFAVKNHRTSYRRVLVVDDIVTTGATFDESKKMLETICEDATCLAMARTP